MKEIRGKEEEKKGNDDYNGGIGIQGKQLGENTTNCNMTRFQEKNCVVSPYNMVYCKLLH